MKAKDEQLMGCDFEKHIEDGINIYAHKIIHIKSLLQKNHFKKEKEAITFIGNDQHLVIVARKMSG
jgi:hypothetical protein